MTYILDSYSELNRDGARNLNGTVNGVGQSFTPNINASLYSVTLYLLKVGTPTGMAYANLYTHSGAYGTSSVPTGTPLAVSNPFDVSTLSTSYSLVEILFKTMNTIFLTANSNYVITLEYANGSSSNYVSVGDKINSPTHSGNESYYSSGAWNSSSTRDVCFYLNGSQASPLPTLFTS